MNSFKFIAASILFIIPGIYTITRLEMPKSYEAIYIKSEINIDGSPDKEWERAEWSDLFMDIEGPDKEPPRYETKVKMMWDEEALYILAWLEEEDIWATLEEKDAIIYHDNDFEIFVKPDPLTEHYYEYELNANNTLMDLLLTKPYNKGGKALLTWNSKEVKHAVQLNGTLNIPQDTDIGWYVEVMIPYQDLMHSGARIRPSAGKFWKINFSRVEWQVEKNNGRYVKSKDNQGRRLRECNWVWTPQYAINMHIPEHWGKVIFRKN